MDLSKIFPYVVPAGYVEKQPSDPEGLIVPLGHDVFVMAVHDLDGVCRNVLPEEVVNANITPKALHAQAVENLVKLAQSGVVQWGLQRSKRGLPFLVCSGHWLAASCITLPNLWSFAKNHLAGEEICASIPQREAMLLFPIADRSFRTDMRALILEKEGQERKLITFELFQVSSTGVVPFVETNT